MMSDRTREQRAALDSLPVFSHIGRPTDCAACAAGVLTVHSYVAPEYVVPAAFLAEMDAIVADVLARCAVRSE